MTSCAPRSLQFALLRLLVAHVSELTSYNQCDQPFTVDRHPNFMESQGYSQNSPTPVPSPSFTLELLEPT